jgi:RES domain-containing protein
LRVYRVFRRKHAATAFSGEGARRYGGRWNSVGRAVVYTSTTFSLALLELMVNTSSARIPPDMVYVPVDIPDDVLPEVLQIGQLPKNWFDFPAPPECHAAGDSWLQRGATVALVVPSAVARIERNVLLNPAHPDFAHLIVGNVEAVAIDNRLKR